MENECHKNDHDLHQYQNLNTSFHKKGIIQYNQHSNLLKHLFIFQLFFISIINHFISHLKNFYFAYMFNP